MIDLLKNKYVISVIKYTLIYIITLVLSTLLLVLVSKIPKSKIEKNIIESAKFYKDKEGIEELLKRRDYTFVHYYADSILLNVIYSEDSNHPAESAMWAKYYEKIKMDTNKDFVNMVKDHLEPNQQYIRYWHGSIIILKPLLVFFNIEQIYIINKILMYLMALVLFIILFKKSKKVSIIFLFSMIMVAFPIVPKCIEYTWTFYIMIIVSIISLLIEKKGDKPLYTLFFITGMITCYFDFLTTELITLFVPLLLIVGIRKEENRNGSFKECVFLLLKCSMLWGISYVAMWFSKWILASLILNINAMDYVKDSAWLRLNGLQNIESKEIMYTGAIYKNFHNLYPLNIVKKTSTLWIYVGIVFSLILATFDWKNIKKKWFSLIMLIIGIIPYIRYLILANHSYKHAFFTFRSQIITIIALGLIVLDCFNRELIKKKHEE